MQVTGVKKFLRGAQGELEILARNAAFVTASSSVCVFLFCHFSSKRKMAHLHFTVRQLAKRKVKRNQKSLF
jgi:hypothetical protein